MMSESKKKIPKRRFKEFENADAWEQRKLGDEVQITMGQSPDGSTYTDIPSDYILVQGNADLKNGWVMPRVWTSQVTKKAEAGDLIMSVRAPAGEMGKTAYNAIIGRGVAAIKGNEFIFQSLVKMNFEGYWKRLSCGSTFESLNSDNIKNAEIMIPHLNEQLQIGSFFENLDTLITLHQRKADKLKALKSAYLNEMFPTEGETKPKRRFKGFTGDWEQRKLSEFADKAVDNRGKTPPIDPNGNHPLIEVASLGGSSPDYLKVEKYLNDFAFENNLRDYIKKGDILFSTVGSIGLVSLMDINEHAAIAQNIVAFRAKENYVPEYLYALFSNEENKEKAYRIVMGAVQPSIKVTQLVNVEYSVSKNIKEQEMIGQYFVQLDNLITLHQRKVDKLQNLKKAYLNEMFI